MPQFADIQRQLDDVKSRIAQLELDLETAQDKSTIEQELSHLREEQVRLTQQLEDQTGLSGAMGDVNKG